MTPAFYCCTRASLAPTIAASFTCHSALLADYEESPPQPGPDDPGARQLQLLECLAAEAPLEHPAFATLGDGTELVADSFRLTFAEAAARGASWNVLGCAMSSCVGGQAE